MDQQQKDKHYKENNKIYRVFRTVVEMCMDRGYYVPMELMEYYNSYLKFVLKYRTPLPMYSQKPDQTAGSRDIGKESAPKCDPIRPSQSNQYCPDPREGG